MVKTKPNIIVRLPEELRAFVLSFCDSSSVLNLCLTSKATHNFCIPSLFHIVDLSTHNEAAWRQSNEYINIIVPADHPRRVLTIRDHKIVHRQRRFVELLDRNPGIGSQIRVVRWTMMDVPPEVMFNETIGTYGTVQRRIKPWQTFQLCTRVSEVDLAFMNHWNAIDVPPSLFSTATSVSLSGVVGHTLLSSIFTSIDTSKLRHLRLNNVQTFADPQNIQLALESDNIETCRRDFPGAMMGYLAPLIGHCQSLKSLHIVTTAEFVDVSTRLNGVISRTWDREVADEHRRYSEIGAFLSSVKHNLREFIFEHGPDIDYYGSSPGKHSIQAFAGPNHDSSLPMDVYFDAHVLPVIASGPWPRIQKMVVRGIGHWKPLNLWTDESTPGEISYLHRKTREFRDRADMIWDAVGGNDIDIVVEDEASQPLYRLQADKRRSLTGDAA